MKLWPSCSEGIRRISVVMGVGTSIAVAVIAVAITPPTESSPSAVTLDFNKAVPIQEDWFEQNAPKASAPAKFDPNAPYQAETDRNSSSTSEHAPWEKYKQPRPDYDALAAKYGGVPDPPKSMQKQSAPIDISAGLVPKQNATSQPDPYAAIAVPVAKDDPFARFGGHMIEPCGHSDKPTISATPKRLFGWPLFWFPKMALTAGIAGYFVSLFIRSIGWVISGFKEYES